MAPSEGGVFKPEDCKIFNRKKDANIPVKAGLRGSKECVDVEVADKERTKSGRRADEERSRTKSGQVRIRQVRINDSASQYKGTKHKTTLTR